MKIGRSGRCYHHSITWAEVQAHERMFAADVATEERLRERRERARSGLVYPAISHRVTYKVYAGMVSFKYPSSVQPSQLRGVRRGIVSGWSPRSRKRMMDAISQWRAKGKLFFITLTYHDEYADHFSGWKRDIDVFIKRLKRRLKNVGGVWKLEFQKRGAPHFHLIVSADGADYYDLMRFVSKAWSEIAHQSSVHKGKYATNVRTIVSRRHAMHYAAKYMSKAESNIVDDETGEIIERQTGRIWSVFGSFDRQAVIEAATSYGQAEEWRQAMLIRLTQIGSRYARNFSEMDKHRGWSVYGVGIDEQGNSETLHWRDFTKWAYEIMEQQGC